MDDVKPSRRDKAALTRKKILDAAHAEFTARGFHGATMASIAARAGVAGQTVYFVFHTKAAIISALIDALVMGDEAVIPEETPWWRAMIEDPDATEALRHFIRGAGPLFQRASHISEILRAGALTDDELRVTYQHHENMRSEGFRQVIDLLAAKANLRSGLDRDQAADILLTVFGDSTYYVMTVERGWSHERFIEWMCEAAPAMLLAP